MTTDDYRLLPDGADIPWVEWLRPRLEYSFRSCFRQGNDYILDDPFIRGEWDENHNLYVRGRGFYAAGRLLDRGYLARLMDAYRRASAHDHSPFRMIEGAGESGNRHHWRNNHAAMEIIKLCDALTSGFVNRDRISTTNIYMGVEMCMKAICAHANSRDNRQWKFPATHDLIDIWKEYPAGLQEKLEESSREFRDKYRDYRDKLNCALDTATRQSGGPMKFDGQDPYARDDRELARICSAAPYSVFFNDNDQLLPETLAPEWLLEALHGVRDLNYHRYGLDKGPTYDPFPVYIVDQVHWMGKLFYEHLFPGKARNARKIKSLMPE